MAKRFTDTEKWNKRFIRGLQGPYKLLWLFLTDECNHAGIWEVDFDVARVKTGERKINEADALKFFKDKVVVIDDGKKWFIPDFIEFQYGSLSENNRAHTKIIFLLKKFNLIEDDLSVKGLVKPLASPLQGDKNKEMDKDKEKDKEKGGVGENREASPTPIKTGAKILFANSPFFELSVFEEAFRGTEYESFNLPYYHEAAKNWSAEGNKKIDWIATVRNWMLRDAREGKAAMKNQNLLSNNGTTSRAKQPAVNMQSAYEKLNRMS